MDCTINGAITSAHHHHGEGHTGNTHEAQVLLLDRDSQGKPTRQVKLWGNSVLKSQELLAVG